MISNGNMYLEITAKAKTLNEIYTKRFSPDKSGSHVSLNESTELLRSIVQYTFDQEIDKLIKKFVQVYFLPAIQNIREVETSIPEDVLSEICCSLLEKTKHQYVSTTPATTVPKVFSSKLDLSESDSNSETFNEMETSSSQTETETIGQDITEELLGKIAEEISEEDISQAFSFEDSFLSEIPCLSLSPPPLMDALYSSDFKVPLPPISTITSSLSKQYAPFSSLFSASTEPCLELGDLDIE